MLRGIHERVGVEAKPVLAVALALLCALLAEVVPALAPLRVFSAVKRAPSRTEAVPSAPPETAEGEAVLERSAIVSEARLDADESAPVVALDRLESLPDFGEPPRPLVDANGRALDQFFASLDRTRRGDAGAITRVLHYGDSLIVSDYVSGTLRRRMQGTFGDAGHGYQLMANAWPAYFHNDVFRFATAGFRASRIVGPETKDGLYGLGGVTFRSFSGLRAQFGTEEKGTFGRSVSKFIVSYLELPGAGSLEVWIDGAQAGTIETDGPSPRVARREFSVPDGPHRFEIVTRGGETRTFGVVMERDVAGVVWDALGIQGARIRFLDKIEPEHFADELRWRAPQLVVFEFGTNESGDGYAYPMPEYQRTMQEVLRRVRAAVPSADCLIIGTMDRARVEDGQITSMKIIQLIVAEQEKAAAEVGCAYFDTYQAMGGWGSMPAWVRRGLGQKDMMHPTGVGADRIGTWVFQALMQSYRAYSERPVAPGSE